MIGTRKMGAIEDVYEDLDADVSAEEFREAVEEKVEQMGGLADEETAAMLVAHEIGEGDVEGVADVEPGMDDVQFTAKVTDAGELRSFDRDDGDEGRVLNAEVADETGAVRITFWDKMAVEAAEQLEAGDVIGVGGRPKEGYSGVEVNVDDVKTDVDEDVDVQVGDTHAIEDLSLGMSGVNVRGRVLDAGSVRTFERDDGSEGRVAGVAIGDPTGRIRVTLWDDMADRAGELSAGESVEVVDGYVRERDGDLELHCNDRSAVEGLDEDVEYVPESTPIEALEIGQRVDIAGVVRTADPKRTFDRDDGSEGQVRNVRVQDDTGDVRVALWGEKADVEVGPGDRVAIADVEVQDGWQDDIEASANWRSTVTVLGESDPDPEPATADADAGADAGLDAFGDDGGDDDGGNDAGAGGGTTTAGTGGGTAAAATETVEFTGTVVQAGDPVVLDDGERTVSVETDADVHLGQEVTVRGRRVEDGRVDADEVF
jgi:replication factor A1